MAGNSTDFSNQQLNFQDFSPFGEPGGEALLDIETIQQPVNNLTNQTTAPPNNNLRNAEPEQSTEPQSSPSFWTIEYYQKYFNVTTKDVVERIKTSMIPIGNKNHLLSQIYKNPDLYGPFWICITLIFAIAVSGNMANYFHTAMHNSSGKFHWKYDFHLVSIVATCVFLYAWLLPMIIWGVLKWTNSQQPNNQEELIESQITVGLLDIICVYGYSLSIYVPIAFLWTIQISWFQWSLVIIAACVSGGMLVRSLMTAISDMKTKLIFMAVIFSMHLLFTMGFMLYFFYDGDSTIPSPVTDPPHKLNVVSTTMNNSLKSQ